MNPLIYLLPPKSYIKKSQKSPNVFFDVDNFINELQKRVVDSWNCRLEIDNVNGSAYKIKFDQFEKKFIKKSDLVFYVVSSSSAESFKTCMEKLLKSCKKLDILNKIFVLSICSQNIDDLNCSQIEKIYFGDDWQTENAKQWDILENMLRSKTNILLHDANRLTESLTISISNSGRKSPSKFKTFFHSLPSRKTLFSHKNEKEYDVNTVSGNDIRIPDIDVSDMENIKNSEDNNCSGRRNKVDSTKLSLNSLFRRRSKKTRDSGLSMNSSISNGSSSRKSDTIITRGSLSAEFNFDGKENISSVGNQSPVIQMATLNKAEKHKAKVEIFKAKANKVMRSAGCLQSPEQKRSKYHMKDAMHNVVHFSSTIITASSDIGNQSEYIPNNRQKLKSLLNNRSRSEPPVETCNNINSDTNSHKRIKYYSWNEDSSDEKVFTPEDYAANDLEFTSSGDSNIVELNQLVNGQPCNDNEENLVFMKNYEDQEEIEKTIVNNDDSEVFYTTFKPENTEKLLNKNLNDFLTHNNSDNSFTTFLPHKNEECVIEEKNRFEECNISLNCESSQTTNPKDTPGKKIKHDHMTSLDQLIKSIQISCDEMKSVRKVQDCNNNENGEKSCKHVDILKCDSIEKTENISSQIKSLESYDPTVDSDPNSPINEVFVEESQCIPNSDYEAMSRDCYREMSPELIAVADSITKSYNSPSKSTRIANNTLIRNPFVVSGIFAATALTAPVWCTYIPRNICFTKLFYGTLDYIFYSDIVQSIPNQIISTGRSSAAAATYTLKRLNVLIPSTQWFNTYRIVPAFK